MLSKKWHYAFHLSAYYLAWLSGIRLAAKGDCWRAVAIILAISFIQIMWQCLVIKRTQGLLWMISIFTVLGFVIDSLCLQFNILYFSANPFGPHFSAPWMIALWFNFAILFYSILESFFQRYLLVGLLSLLAFPLTYWCGAELGAASFPRGELSNLGLGLIWGFLFPLCLYFYNSRMKNHA